MFIDFKKRGRGERNIDVGEKHRPVASHTDRNQESNPQPFGVQDDATTKPHRPGWL